MELAEKHVFPCGIEALLFSLDTNSLLTFLGYSYDASAKLAIVAAYSASRRRISLFLLPRLIDPCEVYVPRCRQSRSSLFTGCVRGAQSTARHACEIRSVPVDDR